LGIQLLAETSEEGNAEGLGFIRGNVLRLPASVKVPHIGWNSVKLRKDHKILKGLDDESYFYFAHSYHLNMGDIDIVYGWTNYGVSFPSIVVKGNIVGTQFHPEKSGMKGLGFLRNFVEELR